MADAKKETAASAAKESTAASAEVKEPKKRGRKPSSTTKKSTTKKTTRKTTSKAAEGTQETVVLQFYGEDANVNDIVGKIKDTFAGEGHRISSIKKLQVYLKPEERAAYYVINDKQAGKVDLF